MSFEPEQHQITSVSTWGWSGVFSNDPRTRYREARVAIAKYDMVGEVLYANGEAATCLARVRVCVCVCVCVDTKKRGKLWFDDVRRINCIDWFLFDSARACTCYEQVPCTPTKFPYTRDAITFACM